MKKKVLMFLTVIMGLVMTVTANAYKLPQMYSSDSYDDEIPEITIPGEPEKQKGTYVYLNKEKMAVSDKVKIKNDNVYLPVEEFFSELGFDVAAGSTIKIEKDNMTAVFKKGSASGTVNGKEVSLSNKIVSSVGGPLAPCGIANEVLNAKVWYDEDSNTLVITTGKYKSDNILRIINGKFWMNGEPYYEISFNKYDLAEQVGSKYARNSSWGTEAQQVPAAEAALSQLHELGFRSIRVFTDIATVRAAYFRSQKQKDLFYEAMDEMYDLCDKYQIQVVESLSLTSNDFVVKGEDYFDLICDPNSKSREQLYTYLDEYITRYKDRYSVLMWEIVNEGNLAADIGWQVKSNTFSLYQLGQFYTDCAERIRKNDPERLVTGGDACFRPSQWHQYLGVKKGMIGVDWTRDTLEDRMKAYVMAYSGLDVISMHCYSTGLTDSAYRVSDTDDTEVKEDFNLYMKECKKMGKPFYNGETAVAADDFNEEVLQQSREYLQTIIKEGVQISHWWTFRCDVPGASYGWRIDSGELLDAIVAANKQIKEIYVVNGVKDENTYAAFEGRENDVIIESIPENPGMIHGLNGCGGVTSDCAIIVMTAVIAAAVLNLKRKKEKI